MISTFRRDRLRSLKDLPNLIQRASSRATAEMTRRDMPSTINSQPSTFPNEPPILSITSREVEVTRIPSGERITLPSGTQVVITQALGGSFTILVPSQAGLYRIEGQDADSIGQEASPRSGKTR